MPTLTSTLQVVTNPNNIGANETYLVVATEDGQDDVLVPLSAIGGSGGAVIRPDYTLPTCKIIHDASGITQVGVNEQKTAKVEATVPTVNFTVEFIFEDAGDLISISWQNFDGNIGNTLNNGGSGWPWQSNDPKVSKAIAYTKGNFDRGSHSFFVNFDYNGVPHDSSTGNPASDQDLREKLNNQGVIDIENVFGAGTVDPFNFVIEALYKVFARKGNAIDNTQTITNWTTGDYPGWEDENPFVIDVTSGSPVSVVEWAIPSNLIEQRVENYNPFTDEWSTVPHTTAGSVSYTLPDSSVITYNIVRAVPDTEFTAPVRLIAS